MVDENVDKDSSCKQTSPECMTSREPCTSATQPSDAAPPKRPKVGRKLHIAVAGCSHGEMDKIYGTLAGIEQQQGYKFDLLISCGDYQAIRNYGDLKHMHCPEKYRDLRTFYRYYSGELVAPVLTLFIGGNHEASGYLQELPNGGWVAPNIYYLGHASVVQFAGLRIGGLSGIYNKNHYDMDPVVDIMVTHDWPAGITDYGDVKQLLRLKPYFEEDLKKNAIGNPVAMTLLHELRPRYWLAAHLHCAFAALVPHANKNDPENNFEPTRFLSLDKPLPGRHFLQALEFDVDENVSMALSYDPAWLAILKSTDSFTSASKNKTYMPSQHVRSERWDFKPTEEELTEVRRIYADDFTIPVNFQMTAKPHQTLCNDIPQELYYRNPQATEFCAKLGIRDLNAMLCALSLDGLGTPYYLIKSNESECGAVEGGADNEKKELDSDNTFVIDRNPSHEASFLEDFTAPPLRGSDPPGDDIDSDDERSIRTDIREGPRRVGSGIFRRRPVDIPEEE